MFRQVTRRSFDRFQVPARRAAGLPEGFTYHILRHLYLSNSIGAGVEPFEVSEFLGHNSLKLTLETYGHVVSEKAARAADLLDRQYVEWMNGTL